MVQLARAVLPPAEAVTVAVELAVVEVVGAAVVVAAGRRFGAKAAFLA